MRRGEAAATADRLPKAPPERKFSKSPASRSMPSDAAGEGPAGRSGGRGRRRGEVFVAAAVAVVVRFVLPALFVVVPSLSVLVLLFGVRPTRAEVR